MEASSSVKSGLSAPVGGPTSRRPGKLIPFLLLKVPKQRNCEFYFPGQEDSVFIAQSPKSAKFGVPHAPLQCAFEGASGSAVDSSEL